MPTRSHCTGSRRDPALARILLRESPTAYQEAIAQIPWNGGSEINFMDYLARLRQEVTYDVVGEERVGRHHVVARAKAEANAQTRQGAAGSAGDARAAVGTRPPPEQVAGGSDVARPRLQ